MFNPTKTRFISIFAQLETFSWLDIAISFSSFFGCCLRLCLNSSSVTHVFLSINKKPVRVERKCRMRSENEITCSSDGVGDLFVCPLTAIPNGLQGRWTNVTFVWMRAVTADLCHCPLQLSIYSLFKYIHIIQCV